MKLLLAVLSSILLIVVAPAASDREPFWLSNLEDGMKRGRTLQKPVVIYFKADWCGWCQKMSRMTFKSPTVLQLLTETVNVLVDADKAQSGILSRYKVSGFPTTLVLDEGGREICRISGYAGPDSFGGLIANSLRAFVELPTLRQLANQKPPNREALVRIIGHQTKLEAFAEARKSLLRLEATALGRADSVVAQCWNDFADVFQANRRYREAIPIFGRALKYAANTSQKAYANLSIASCYASLGEKQKTILKCKEVLAYPGLGKEDTNIANQMLKAAQVTNDS